MNTKLFVKCALNFRALGMSWQEVGTSFERCTKSASKLSVAFHEMLDAFSFSNRIERKLAHRKRCTLIAFAMSQTCSPKKKWILWNMFKNQKL